VQDPSKEEVMYVKRLVGLPGDRINIGDGRIWVNNMEMNFGDPDHPIQYQELRPKISRALDPLTTTSYVVPEQNYFVLGDNSANSYDSRYWGALPAKALYGKVTKIYWPWSRMSTPR
jgi:signal peptidase I